MAKSPIVTRINMLLAERGIPKKDFYRDCEITSASYSLWNTGKTQPRMKNLQRIAEYLDVTVADLLPDGAAIPEDDAKKAPTETSERELDKSLIKRLVQLTPDELRQVDAFVQGLLASRPK